MRKNNWIGKIILLYNYFGDCIFLVQVYLN